MILKEKITVVYKYLKIILYINMFSIAMISCSEEKGLNYKDLFLEDDFKYATTNGTYLGFSVQRGKDIGFIIYPSYNLKDEMLRLGGFTHSNYKEQVIDAIEKNFPLQINDSLFNHFEEYHAFVSRNNSIDSLFEVYNNDIIKMLNEAICYEHKPLGQQIIKSQEDAEWASEGSYKYLIYVLFQYGFYVYPDEESGVDYIKSDSEGYLKKKS